MIELYWDLITPSVHCDACMYTACTMIVMEVHTVKLYTICVHHSADLFGELSMHIIIIVNFRLILQIIN